MANPQPDQFTRISNELYEAIMQTDFSKRQRNILDLIIRMSYGCGKKFAILRYSDFEVVGVYKTHIKKELEYLVNARVISIENDRFELNKNYDEWRISIVKPANSDKLEEILRRNLNTSYNEKVTKTVTEVTKTVTTEDDAGYQNSNQEVTKTVTDTTEKPNNHGASESTKEILKKYINKEDEEEAICARKNDVDISEIVALHEQSGFGVVNPTVLTDINYWIEGNYFDQPVEIIIMAMKEANRSNARSWRYINRILIDWSNLKLRNVQQVEAHLKSFHRSRAPTPKTIGFDAKKEEYKKIYGF